MARNKLFTEPVAVIGLGRFGTACALELARVGHPVTVVEKDPVVAEAFHGRVDKVVVRDATQPAAVQAVRQAGTKIAVVGIGSSVEASVLAAVNLVDAGVPTIWAKAMSPEHGRILERIGVHQVVYPEGESGQRTAHLLNGRLLDYLEFDDDFVIVRMRPPAEAVGFTLTQSALRSKYGVTVVGVKALGEEFAYAEAHTKIRADHELIVSGPPGLVERLAARP
ncbi:potassium channel family protein [Lapillicoccus jejuensis]|uniref:Trk system potassium uptake protein TrkA n=1 Tax=Lapillicoccus jejuensis TaxID=402171 RepID=A0A542DX83_9MICO|nr:TrkA family potassium uptake protein [Lapillicoccus jejuensis]TQJ07703.1 trk system potassium uptake protein TrkA [Lapillicoccus jejuensis]